MKRPSPWTTIEINQWSHFEQCVAQCNAGWPNREKWLFRGQPDSKWRLEPTLHRILQPAIVAGRIRTNGDVWNVEEVLMRQFYQDAHNWLPASAIPQKPTQFLWNAWALMRHFGAPTRLLDWSLSAFVALFFACEDCWASSDGAVYCVRGSSVATAEKGRFPEYEQFAGADWQAPAKGLVREQSPTRVIGFYPIQYPADRMYMQQGWFSICSDALFDHETALLDALGDQADGALLQLVIRSDLKAEIMRRLQAMNITGRTLFPGADGLGRSVTGLARLSAEYGV
jgi:FRG domain